MHACVNGVMVMRVLWSHLVDVMYVQDACMKEAVLALGTGREQGLAERKSAW